MRQGNTNLALVLVLGGPELVKGRGVAARANHGGQVASEQGVFGGADSGRVLVLLVAEGAPFRADVDHSVDVEFVKEE